jgi:hypothetical protein
MRCLEVLVVNFCLVVCGGYFYIGMVSNFMMVKMLVCIGIDIVF